MYARILCWKASLPCRHLCERLTSCFVVQCSDRQSVVNLSSRHHFQQQVEGGILCWLLPPDSSATGSLLLLHAQTEESCLTSLLLTCERT